MIDKKAAYKMKLARSDSAVFIAAVVLGVVAVTSYFFWDAWVVSKFHPATNSPDGNVLAQAFRYLGKGWVLIWWLLVWGLITNRLRPTVVGLLALLFLIPVVPTLKTSVGRPRPKEVIAASSKGEENDSRLRGHSFPSGDAAGAFAVATALAGLVRWPCKLVLFTVSTGVGVLRVIDLAHYPSDVAAGAAIGVLSGWLALHISRRWLLLDSSQFNWRRGTALFGVILIPAFVWVFQGYSQSLTFLGTHGSLAVGIYVIARVRNLSGR